LFDANKTAGIFFQHLFGNELTVAIIKSIKNKQKRMGNYQLTMENG
jgi:hypothetical protein